MKMIVVNQYTWAIFFFYIIVSWLYKKWIFINCGLFKASKIAINLGLFEFSNHLKEQSSKDLPSKKESSNPLL